MRRTQRGFTLLELLVVVLILGVLTALMIFRLLSAIDRGRQKRTMSDLRTISIAVEAYAVDYLRFPSISQGTALDLVPYLAPTYARALPVSDGWRMPIGVWVSMGGDVYTIISGGADQNTTPAGWTWGPTTDMTADIVMSQGSFAQWPEGMQTKP